MAILFLSIQAFSQSDTMDKLFRQYANDNNFSIGTINPKTIIYNDASPADKKTINQITAMRTLKTEINTGKIYEEVLRSLGAPPYERLASMSLHSAGDNVTCFAKKINNQISELVMVEDNGKFMLLSVKGNNLDVKGIENLNIGFRDFTAKSPAAANTTITKNIGDFTALKVNNGIPAKLVASSKKTVEISGKDNRYVRVSNNNGVLSIGMPGATCDNCDIKVVVNYTTLNNIQTSSAATVNGADVLKTPALKLSTEAGGAITLKIQTQQLSVEATSGGVINLSGAADNQKIDISSGAKYEAENLQSKNVDITANTKGRATIFVTNKMTYTLSTKGVITAYGHPKDLQDKSFNNDVTGGTLNIN
ncbi:MAG: DUF4252 domain-containing protein [Chitinophagaceae bacterium]|nr:DUF4252 domain-containing protein [Chitinophagaceae bacterium]